MVKLEDKVQQITPAGSESLLNTPDLLSEMCLLRGEYNRDLQIFIESVFETFLLEDERTKFLELIHSGEVSFVDISSGSYKRAYDFGMIFFREPKIHNDILEKVKFPADPADTGKFPPMLVDVDGGILVIEGNHRVYKAIQSTGTDNNDLFALRFSSTEAFSKLFDYEISRNFHMHSDSGWGETRPALTNETRRKALKSAW